MGGSLMALSRFERRSALWDVKSSPEASEALQKRSSYDLGIRNAS
jgi:hypothetical protein